MWRAIWKFQKLNLVVSGVFKLVADLLEFVGPLILNEFIRWSVDRENVRVDWIGKDAYGYVLSTGMFLSMFLANYFQELHYMVRFHRLFKRNFF
jgi:hypothetical protein